MIEALVIGFFASLVASYCYDKYSDYKRQKKLKEGE